MTLRLPILALQAAIFARIKSDYPTREVFIYVPGQNKLPPFITIGGSTAVEFTTKTSQAYDVSLQIHCWSQTTGNTEVIAMANEVIGALTRADLDLSADLFLQWRVDLERADFTVEMGDEIGLIQHGVISIKFGVEDISEEA